MVLIETATETAIYLCINGNSTSFMDCEQAPSVRQLRCQSAGHPTDCTLACLGPSLSESEQSLKAFNNNTAKVQAGTLVTRLKTADVRRGLRPCRTPSVTSNLTVISFIPIREVRTQQVKHTASRQFGNPNELIYQKSAGRDLEAGNRRSFAKKEFVSIEKALLHELEAAGLAALALKIPTNNHRMPY